MDTQSFGLFFFRFIFFCPEHGSGAMIGFSFLFFTLRFLFSVIQKTDFFSRATCTTTQCTRGGEDRDSGHFFHLEIPSVTILGASRASGGGE